MTRAFRSGPGPGAYTVASLTAKIKGLIDREFPDVKVAGEISNAGRSTSGHWYFTLKDARAEINCVCFRREAQYLRVKPSDGLAVLARGRVSVYPSRGQYRLYVDALAPQGVGSLQQEFERLKAQLAEEGLFDEGRKRPLPPLPTRVGIVTSPTGAAIADILRTMERRFRGLHVRLFPARVQGDGAAREIAEGIRFFSEHPWAEVVIVGRGGGSLEELWAFNEEIVARAIVASKVPIISAVGHETDVTIADFASDLRAATPSVAAERVVPESDAVRERFRTLETHAAQALDLRMQRLKTRVLEANLERAARSVMGRIDQGWQGTDSATERLRTLLSDRLGGLGRRLEGIARTLGQLDLRVRLLRHQQHLGEYRQRLIPAIRSALDRRQARLTAISRALDSLSPVAILERGYAIVSTSSGVPVREHRQVGIDDALDVRLHRGRLAVRVTGTRPESPGSSELDSKSV